MRNGYVAFTVSMSAPSYVAVSLLMLAFLPETIRPQTTTICESRVLGKNFSVGENWTEPTCLGMACLPGGPQTSLCLHGGLTPIYAANSGCVVKNGTPGAEFPKCCDKIECPEPDQCYSPALKRTFNDGEQWTEPPCERRRCENGTSLATSCPRHAHRYRQGCLRINGTPNAEYPKCCDNVACPEDICIPEAVNRAFNVKDTWTKPSCDERRCAKGVLYVTHCPSYNPRRLKELEEYGCSMKPSKTPTAAYPACCDQLTCPRNDQCYSPGLKKIFNDKENWTEPSCELNQCKNGTRFFTGCKKYTNLAGTGCKLKPGVSNASYPLCCEQLVCPAQCYSKALNRTFKNGEEWIEPPCQSAKCVDGYIGTADPCPSPERMAELATVGCVRGNGTGRYGHPVCCNVNCPRRDQCYSAARNRTYNSGDYWFEKTRGSKSQVRCEFRKCRNGATWGYNACTGGAATP